MLSDGAIRSYLARGLLVPGGNHDDARHAAYNFHAGKIFPGGEKCVALDWTAEANNGSFVIVPGAMVWVRMKEEVRLPNDICAAWYQTHTLSKKGIMLINISIVDPGYKGFLACLFVNFGSQKVIISPDTIMARLVFYKLDKSAQVSYDNDVNPGQYDADIENVALNGPATFMRVAELVGDLQNKKNDILREIAADAPKRVFAAYGWAGLGFLLLLAATRLVPYVQEFFSPNLEYEVRRAVDDRISDHLSLSSESNEPALEKKVAAMESEIQTLRNNIPDKITPSPTNMRKIIHHSDVKGTLP